jgi:tRNA 2-selenouridine synthase
MPLNTLPATAVPALLDTFDTVIDARSEDEFAHDHIPGALNWPSLNNQERIDIGTLYKQVNAFEAKKRGAALAARNIAAHIEREVIHQPKSWRPLVYCWRGGNRSGALATILSAIGFQVTLVEGGYKAWRQAMLANMTEQVAPLQWRVVCGPTGAGKTRLLHAIERAGAQVLDLERLAVHRSSVLGLIPGQPQPTQKRFESLLWDALRRFDPQRPVYLESESRKVGNLRLPEALIDAMRASPCLDLQLSEDERVELLMEDYAFFLQEPDFFCQRLEALTALRGKSTVDAWTSMVRQGQTVQVVKELLTLHYDPVYSASIQRNFALYGQATPCPLPNRSDAAMDDMAAQLLSQA